MKRGIYIIGDLGIKNRIKMKNETPPTPTIAELWGKLKVALQTNLEARLTADTTDNGKHGTPPSLSIAISEVKITALRQQLLERCKRVWDSDGCYTEFEICGKAVKAILYLSNGSRFSGSRKDDANSALEMSAAYAFLAREIEQRQKEMEAQNEK